MESLISLDQELLIFLNSLNSHVWDQIMILGTNKYTWTPLYLYFCYCIFKSFSKQGILILVSIVLMILVTDQFTSSFMKPFFERLRPCHEPSIAAILHSKVNCGGQFGFASSHSANSFAIAAFMVFLMRPRAGWWILFLWATIVAYSRVYLGVHYPGDVIVGGLIGVLFGWLFFRVQSSISYKILSRL